MARITVGCEYKKEFESIRDLYSGGFLSDKVNIKRVTDSEIVTNTDTFEYCDSEHGVNGSDGGAGTELCFGKNGASWFAGLRGEKFDSSSSDFEQLIGDAASDYHKYYSIIEFRQSVEDRLTAVGGSPAGAVKRVNTEFLKRVFGSAFVLSERYSVEPENYYAVSMRLEINGGAESEPLLGKVYFRIGRDGKFIPVRQAAACDIDDYITTAVPPDVKGERASNELADGKLVNGVLGEIEKLFERDDSADYILFNRDYRSKIEKMLKLIATSDEKELECTHVAVLGISHVEWQNFAYSAMRGGKKAMKLVVGLNNNISLYCMCCDKHGVQLIDGNVVLFGDPQRHGRYVLDFEKPGLGLSDDDLLYIRKNALLSEHILNVACPDNPRNRDCVQTVCASQSVEYKTADGKTLRKCKRCPYPEVIYRDIFEGVAAESRFTRSLSIDEQRFKLTDKETRVCPCCGRRFTPTANARLCDLCSNTEFTEQGRRLYKKYGKMLSPSIRIKHVFSKKCCREDSNIIIFELGNDRYVFDKLNAHDHGLIEPPRKV